jgi:peptidoglycan-N-acetylglucosamine deacetylase
MRALLSTLSLLFLLPAIAAVCPGNPTALGTTRTAVVDPTELHDVGRMQYPQSLPLAYHEVVLTFDDGPLSPYTAKVLDLLASQCVKAVFFDVGRMATSYPWLVRREYDEGHTVGTHTQNHPLRASSDEALQDDIAEGIASVDGVLGRGKVAPFFRFPGLIHPPAVENDLASQGIMVWSADVVGDDWKRISPHAIVQRTIAHLERRGRGIVLLHDIHRRTVSALPELFARLKERGYRVVQVVAKRVLTARHAWSSAP